MLHAFFSSYALIWGQYQPSLHHTLSSLLIGQVRMADNMQYAFSYFYFLMSEMREVDIEDTYKKLDTDHTKLVLPREVELKLSVSS